MTGLDWTLVRARYPAGRMVPHMVGQRRFEVLRVTDDALHFRWDVIEDGTISRCHLERAVELIEEGVLITDPAAITSDYRTLVSDERPTIAAALLKDLGYW